MANLTKYRLPLVVGVSVLFLGLTGSGAWSIWSTEDRGAGISADTGVLDIEPDQTDAYWVRTTNGYTSQLGPSYLQPCGSLDPDGEGVPSAQNCRITDSDSVVTMPGDTFDYVMPVTTSLAGNNLAAGFSIAITDDAVTQAVKDGLLDVEFYVATPSTEWTQMARVAPPIGQPLAQVGDVVALPGTVPGAGNQLVSDYLVVAHVTVLGNYNWATDFSADPDGEWSASALNFSLVQIRPTAVSATGTDGGDN